MANILLFIPLGIFVGDLWKWKGLLVGVGLTVSIELFQLISRRGLFEFDDIIHNTLGTVIGILLCLVFEKSIKTISERSRC